MVSESDAELNILGIKVYINALSFQTMSVKRNEIHRMRMIVVYDKQQEFIWVQI